MKKTAILFFVLVFGSGIVSAQNKKLIDKVIAQVGSELILLSDLETEYNYLKSMNQASGDETKCMILEQIMAQKLLIDQAKLDSIEVSDDQVDGQLSLRMDAILRQMGGDEELFKQYYGKSVAEMKEIYREDIKNKLMAESMQQSLLDNINVTPSEVVEFFNSIPKDSLPYFNSEVELAQIIIAPEISEKEKQRAYETAKDIKARLDKGEDFGALAKKYSEDPGSAQNNGDLGWVKRGTFVPKFEAAAYGLKKGETSDIVETEFGYHIIQLLERRGNSIHARHILIKPDITLDDLNKAKAKLDSIRTLIVNDSMKFETAVKKFSDKKSMSYNNNGRMTNPATQTTFYEMKDLPPDIYFAIEGLKPGDVTSVMETTNETGETRYQIIKVLTKTEPHRANLKEDYSRIQNFAKASKKNEYINNWVEKKIKTTYIKIDDEYKKCPNINKWLKNNN
ncbi:MAG TPA: peptidylprolyl isomerase [Bacteroidetes bacterium]|nr:peptidylprolyl isomerase [Bacteroidota bacterium]